MLGRDLNTDKITRGKVRSPARLISGIQQSGKDFESHCIYTPNNSHKLCYHQFSYIFYVCTNEYITMSSQTNTAATCRLLSLVC